MFNDWNQTRRMKSLATGPMTTLEYSWWRSQRVNGLDGDIHKLEVEKLRKGKNKAEEDWTV
ncbi:hypothetical protein Golax_010179 [Gossypium laxum]|uniref:Uncharacterized protein n=1 Tax=Gossypium laxum TaxID=34288 RepID=A0A7J8ZI33_9ROSI|nr:hypothetical protein [Gossypium laxum]